MGVALGKSLAFQGVNDGDHRVAMYAQALGQLTLRLPVLGRQRADRGRLICRTRHGFVCANGGIDASNVGPASGDVVKSRLRPGVW